MNHMTGNSNFTVCDNAFSPTIEVFHFGLSPTMQRRTDAEMSHQEQNRSAMTRERWKIKAVFAGKLYLRQQADLV